MDVNVIGINDGEITWTAGGGTRDFNILRIKKGEIVSLSGILLLSALGRKLVKIISQEELDAYWREKDGLSSGEEKQSDEKAIEPDIGDIVKSRGRPRKDLQGL